MKVTQLHWSVFLLLLVIAFYGAIMLSDLTFQVAARRKALQGNAGA